MHDCMTEWDGHSVCHDSALERVAGEVLPTYRDDRAAEDEFGRDSVERDEQWLAELGRRTVEMFVLSHLFSNRMEVCARDPVLYIPSLRYSWWFPFCTSPWGPLSLTLTPQRWTRLRVRLEQLALPTQRLIRCRWRTARAWR